MSNRLSPLDYEVEALHVLGLETARYYARRFLVFTHGLARTPDLVAKQFADASAALEGPSLAVSVHNKQNYVFHPQF